MQLSLLAGAANLVNRVVACDQSIQCFISNFTNLANLIGLLVGTC